VLLAVVAALVGPWPGGAAALGPDRQGSDPSGPAQPAEVRDQVRDVMARPEFDYGPSWLERAFEWIGDQLSELFDAGDGTATGSSFGGGIGALFGWLLIILAVVAVVVLLAWAIVNRAGGTGRSERPAVTDAEVEHRRRADEWLADAERLESEGRWKEAMRARYRNLVRVLVDRRQLPDVPGRTTGELRGDLDRTTPAAREDFDTCCLLFELPWYADVATGPAENARFQETAARVLTAPAADRFDPVTLFDVTGVGREAVSVGAPGDAPTPGPGQPEVDA
jgi:hypothetical protein